MTFRPTIPRDVNNPRFAQEVEVSLGLLFNQLQQVQRENTSLRQLIVANGVANGNEGAIINNGVEQLSPTISTTTAPPTLGSKLKAKNEPPITTPFNATTETPINITQLVGEAADVQKSKVENFSTTPTTAQLLADPNLQDKQLFRIGSNLYVVDGSTNPPTAILLSTTDILNIPNAIVVKAINTTVVTVNGNVTTDQNLMKYSMAAGLLNVAGKCLRLTISGIHDIDNATTVTWKIKIGSVTVLSWTPQTPVGVLTDLPFRIQAEIITKTTGATGTVEAHGVIFNEDKITAGHSSDKPQLDLNTAPSGAIDLTAAQDVQVTITFNAASTANVGEQRVMITEWMPT